MVRARQRAKRGFRAFIDTWRERLRRAQPPDLRLYVTSIASFKSAWGSFVTILLLTTYINLSAIVFLVGAQADELVRKDATPGERGLFERMRAALG